VADAVASPRPAEQRQQRQQQQEQEQEQPGLGQVAASGAAWQQLQSQEEDAAVLVVVHPQNPAEKAAGGGGATCAISCWGKLAGDCNVWAGPASEEPDWRLRRRRLAASCGVVLVLAGSVGTSLALHVPGGAAGAAGAAATAWAVGAAAVSWAAAGGRGAAEGDYAAPLFPWTPCSALLLASILAGAASPAALLQLAGFVAAAVAYYYLRRPWRP
jgi:hypothetical protein